MIPVFGPATVAARTHIRILEVKPIKILGISEKSCEIRCCWEEPLGRSRGKNPGQKPREKPLGSSLFFNLKLMLLLGRTPRKKPREKTLGRSRGKNP